MTVDRQLSEEGGEGHPLARGASPAVIQARLLPEDATRFAAAYEEALAEARCSFDLTGVLALVEEARQLAVLQSDMSAFRLTVRRLAEAATGLPPPDDEPLAVTRVSAGL